MMGCEDMQPTWQDIIKLGKQYKSMKMEYWLNENLFTFSWWILFVTTIGVFYYLAGSFG